MALIALIVWIFLMLFWLIGGVVVSYTPNGPFNGRGFVGYSLLPWVCVLILGLFIFGAFGPTTGIVPQSSAIGSGRP